MINDSIICITGGTGTLGNAIVEYLFTNYKPEKVIVYSRDEFKQSVMQKKFSDSKYNNLRFFLGDVRDCNRLKSILSTVDIVIHAAALKQIPMTEYNPAEAVKTNINGSMNVVSACIDCGVDKAILVSTDKAVSPVNLYGATKLCAEKLFMAANVYNKTQFSCVRYGNVIGSRGSVIPLFQKIKSESEGRPTFPITSEKMTRFWITIEEAVKLVVIALKYYESGIFVPIIPSMSMLDVAKAIDEDCKIKVIGIRPGEKVHESLVSEDNKHIFLVVDDTVEVVGGDFVYTSDDNTKMSIEEMREKIKRIEK